MALVNSYPAVVNAFANPGPDTYRDDPGFKLDEVITQLQDAVEAEETELGSAPGTSDILSKVRVHNGVGLGKNVPQTALKNVLIHGDPPRQQNGDGPFTSVTAPANTDSTYLFDTWYVLSDGNDIADVAVVRTGLPDGARGKFQLDIETINKKVGLFQIVSKNDIADILEAGSCSLSWDQQVVGSSINGVRAAIFPWSGTADAPTRDLVSGTSWGAAGTLPTLVASWAIAGNTAVIGPTTAWVTNVLANVAIANTVTNIAVGIWIDDLTTTLADFLELANICLVPGPVPMRVPRRAEAEEVTRAHALYEVIGGEQAQQCAGAGVVQSTTGASVFIPYLPKRKIPTLTFSAVTDWAVDNGTGTTVELSASAGFFFTTRKSTVWAVTVAAGLTQGRATQLLADGTISARIYVDARF